MGDEPIDASSIEIMAVGPDRELTVHVRHNLLVQNLDNRKTGAKQDAVLGSVGPPIAIMSAPCSSARARDAVPNGKTLPFFKVQGSWEELGLQALRQAGFRSFYRI